ncbi:amidohydrolase family protein [Candidatus Poribacteria bacterium]|nr:amidohydrolase family protein [Candidatus Poribacteria bacterium]
MLLRAKYLMPNSSVIIENGAVAIHGSEIVDVGPYAVLRSDATAPVHDLGEAVLLPGLVNAHTHLELTNHRDLVERTARFTDWLLQLIGKPQDKAWVDQAIQRGIQMCLAGGATTVGDIHGFAQMLGGSLALPLKDSPLRKVVFFETMGFSPERSQLGISRINGRLEAAPATDSLFTPAVSPHAPYSTSATLYRHCLEISQARGLHLCTHLSETQEEIEFLASGTGAFAELLNTLHIPMEGWTPPGVTPVQYLKNLGVLAAQPLFPHCNYLTDGDIRLLAEGGASVAFCPRSHHYFYHTDHPIERLLEAGVNVAIGTDSLASNWSLSMHDELRFLARTHGHIPPETLIDLVTINGAKGLRLNQVGRLEKGWQADVIAVGIANNGGPVIEQILDESAQNLLTVVAGKICYDVFTPLQYPSGSLNRSGMLSAFGER